MERETYLQEIVAYFSHCKIEAFDDETVHQLRRCLLDHLGCAGFAAGYQCCTALADQIRKMGSLREGPYASIWGMEGQVAPWAAAFANAVRTSNIELDDCSGIGASVHPGVYVLSAALAVAESDPSLPSERFIRAVVFGYDICMRMGLLATEDLRPLGMHGPGFVCGLGVAGTVAMLYGLGEEEIYNAICIAASLLPVCPFTSFMEGADAKDLYGGWGVLLGMFAAKAASSHLTGPHHILEGEKSLKAFFGGDKGMDVAPGSHFYIKDTSFKQFSACHSVHPAVTAVKRLYAKEQFRPEEIRHVTVTTYPYSYTLNEGVTYPLTPSSARLCLPYTVAVALIEGDLSPKAFWPEKLQDPKTNQLLEKVTVQKNDGYGDGPFGVRGCKVELELEDGRRLSQEVTSCAWDQAPDDQELTRKFHTLIDGLLPLQTCRELEQLALHFDINSSLLEIIERMRQIGR